MGPHHAAPAGSSIMLWHCCDIKKSRVSLDHAQNLNIPPSSIISRPFPRIRSDSNVLFHFLFFAIFCSFSLICHQHYTKVVDLNVGILADFQQICICRLPFVWRLDWAVNQI